METAAFSKVHAVVAGGATRWESVLRGLEALPEWVDIVLVHDAARPLVSAELIDRVLQAASQAGAAVPGLPLSDTVKRADELGNVQQTISRTMQREGQPPLQGLTAVQTPQGAKVELLRRAYQAFPFDSAEPTDEASLIEALGETVRIVPGDPLNIKITRPEDTALAERLLGGAAAEIRTGFGYDVHAFAPPEAGRTLYLGGIAIEHPCGLEGHSDADVLLHALCDALLGAACLGDIGMLFPNTDPAYRNISSLSLLKTVHQKLRENRWEIVNIDATVTAEAPKLLPHRAAMQQAIGQCLQLEANRISIKATTSEKLGFVGRREGIEASAVAVIRRAAQ